MRILDADRTARLLPYGPLADALAEVLADAARGAAAAPPRVAVALPGGGALLVMPAADERLAVTKLVTSHPRNAEAGLPTVQGEVVVLDARDGRRLALLEGRVVTARRTAAVSALAARTLAPRPEGPLLLVGAGDQGWAHLEAFRELLGVSRVLVASRTRAAAEALAAHARALGAEAAVVGEPGPAAGAGPQRDRTERDRTERDRTVDALVPALAEATLVVTATTSATPVLPDAVREDAFVAAVGAHTPSTAELPPSLVRRARLRVDTVEGAAREAGDLIQAGIDLDALQALDPSATGPPPGTGPVVFKSVGHALWDLAAARTALAALDAAR